MKKIWIQKFDPTYTRQDGLLVLNDQSIPLPPGFTPDPQFRSTVIFPSGARGGDHYHKIRQEVFVGFGEDLKLIIEDPQTKDNQTFMMDPSHHQGKLVALWMEPGLPHAVVNTGPTNALLIEFADHAQESVPYDLSGRQ